MLCPICGATVADGSRFCPVCGAEVSPAAAQSTPNTYNPVQPNAVPAAAEGSTKAPAGSLGGISLPGNIMQLIFPAATILFAILTLIFWICTKIKFKYKTEYRTREYIYTVKEYLENCDKEGIFTVFLILGILLILALIALSALQIVLPLLGKGDQKILRYAAIGCVVLIFLLFLLYVIILKGAYVSAAKKELRVWGADSSEIREEIKEMKKYLKIRIAGTGVLTFITTILAGAAQAAGLVLKKTDK